MPSITCISLPVSLHSLSGSTNLLFIACPALNMSPFTSPHHSGKSLGFMKDKEGMMTILPKDLNIVWGNDNRYWNLPNSDNGVVELCQVSWLEVSGCVDYTNPDKNYEVGFEVSLNQDAFGWGSSPIFIMVKRGKQGKFAWRKYNLNSRKAQTPFVVSGTLVKSNKLRQDSSDHKLYFGMYEVWNGKWKGGLKIHEVFIKELP